MRAGAVTTSRALAEQATASEQIAKSADGLNRMIGQRQQGDERAGHRGHANQFGGAEHAPGVGSVGARAERTDREPSRKWRRRRRTHRSRSSSSLTRTGEHSTASSRVLDQLGEIRQITDRNGSWREGDARRHRGAPAACRSIDRDARPRRRAARTARQGPTVADGQSDENRVVPTDRSRIPGVASAS